MDAAYHAGETEKDVDGPEGGGGLFYGLLDGDVVGDVDFFGEDSGVWKVGLEREDLRGGLGRVDVEDYEVGEAVFEKGAPG